MRVFLLHGRMRWRPAGAGGRLWLKRHRFRLFLGLVVLLAAAILPLACATVVTPPPVPADPVRVYLLDHGRTSALVLPTRDGALLRYVYGNWDWYALERQGGYQGLRALLWPSPAALGRHRYPGPPTPEGVQRTFGTWSEHVYTLTVSGARVRALERKLDALFQQNIATRHVNTDYELEFVRVPDPYYVFHDSNHVVAGWLRQLGCGVRGPAIWSKWTVREPAHP